MPFKEGPDLLRDVKRNVHEGTVRHELVEGLLSPNLSHVSRRAVRPAPPY
jgi:hypothetical protein